MSSRSLFACSPAHRLAISVASCRWLAARSPFDALGHHGSIAVVERFIQKVKSECTRRLPVVSLCAKTFRQKLAWFVAWYNERRPLR
jgi:transposase InsO family protein